MRFEIVHTTSFAYSRAVYLEPMMIRLHPRADPSHLVQDFRMYVDPPPSSRSDGYDAESNAVSRLWFIDTISSLTIRTSSTVQTRNPNRFDYVMVYERSEVLPPAYSDREALVLQRFINPNLDASVKSLAADIAKRNNGDVVEFCNDLCYTIYSDFRQYIREEGDAHPAVHTLSEMSGTCRDFSVLFQDVCSAVGLASRFVSGYQEGDPDQIERDLHAWAEVYIPEAGWRGYDPTQGLAVSDRHIAVAAAANPNDAAPTTGTFRGTGATSQLTTDISIIAIN